MAEAPSPSAREPGITLRPYDVQRDAPRCAELYTQHGPEVYTVERLLEWERLRPAGAVYRSLTAVGPDGDPVGFAEASRAPWAPPGQFGLECLVDPAHRERGVGSLLLDELTTFARANGGTRLTVSVRDHLPDALAFARKRGFEVERHVFESTLPLATFDEIPFAAAVARAEAAGFVFRSLSDYGDTEAARRKLYELNIACIRDIPGNEGSDRPWDEFRKIFTLAWYRPDGQTIVVEPANGAAGPPDVERDRFVALAAIGYFAETNSVYHMHTGVDRAYRGRGLALTAKLVALRRAREWGAAYARTNNDSLNAPILAVNRKLGYVPQPGFYKLIKRLD